MGLVCGDFNNDGWIDVYNLGAKTRTGSQELTTFLLWNPTTKVFDNVNLFNDKSIQSVSGGQVIPVYLNQDDYVDIVVISEGMSGPFNAMAISFSSSLSLGPVGNGEMTLESNEQEFKVAFVYAYEMLTSASIEL